MVTGTLVRKATLASAMEQQLARSAYTMNKAELFMALSSRNAYITVNGHRVILLSIAREDGSGNSFNLRVIGPDGNYYSTYTRAA